jgi:plasmid stabilization system protein ParE
MDFRIEFSAQAASDLEAIIEYISRTLRNPVAAERFYFSVDKKLAMIRSNPKIYPLARDEKLRVGGYRAAAIGNYMMFYLLDEAISAAYISRIAYGVPLRAMNEDLPAIFSSPNISLSLGLMLDKTISLTNKVRSFNPPLLVKRIFYYQKYWYRAIIPQHFPLQ